MHYQSRTGLMLFVTTALALLATSSPATAADFVVLNLADGGPGSLRQAVFDANMLSGSDTVRFAPGLTGQIVLTSGQLSITDSLAIHGPGIGALSVSGNQQSRVFRISNSASVHIAGITITRGRATAPVDGGGILNSGSRLVLDGVAFDGNAAVSSVATSAGRGGAVANLAGATLTATECVFTGNRTVGGPRNRGNGGAITNDASTMTLTRCQFSANEAIGGTGGGPALGGGISNQFGSEAFIEGCQIIGNRAVGGSGGTGIGAARGGGIFNNSSSLSVQDSRIESNVAQAGSNSSGTGTIGTAFGGGVQSADAAPLVLVRCVVRANQAIGGDGNTGGGVNGFVGCAFGGGLNNVGTAAVADCLFEGNECRGGSGNRGDGISFQFVGTGNGGGINTNGGDPSGHAVTLTLQSVTLRQNSAFGGHENTAGTVVGAGQGGGLANIGSNNNFPVTGGSVATAEGCTITHNLALGGQGRTAAGGGVSNTLGGNTSVSSSIVAHNRAQGGACDLTGNGGHGHGGGFYNGAASTHSSNPGALAVLGLDLTNVTSNKAQGGAGSGAGEGGRGQGGGVWSAGSLNTSGGTLSKNAARGGDGGSGADGAGGGLFVDGSSSIIGTSISDNRAVGGDGIGKGGDGLGGGALVTGTGSLALGMSSITENHANGGHGATEGQGVGGAAYLVGTLVLDAASTIQRNHASTSHDDIYQSP